MNEAFRPISLIVAIWPTQDFQFPQDPAALGEELRGQLGGFDEARVTPPPPGAPPNIEWPQLVLIGNQHQTALELAPGKVSLRRGFNQPIALAEVFEAHRAILAPLHAWLADRFNFRAYRLGAVIQLFCNTRSSANAKIAQYCLNAQFLQGQAPYDVQLGVLTRIPLYNGTMANRWLRVRPLRSVDPRHVDFAAQVEVDINTLSEDTSVKTARELAEFLGAVHRHVDSEIPMLSSDEFVD